jgi:subtilisin family serine protease
VKQGAQVINLSLGGPQPSAVLQTAVDNATKAGVLVVVAAGNDSASTANYPAAYPGVISVGACATSDSKDSYSNYHSSVAIAAPGSNIHSTTKGGSYGNMTGTSMASPHVAGAAALVKSLHPDWTPAQVRTALVSTGDPVSGFGSGVKRMNVAKAVAYGGGTAPAPTPTTAPTTAPAPTPTPAPTTGDRSAPVMSNMSASYTTSSVTVRWMTNEPADTQIEIGLTTNPTSRSAYDARLLTSHASYVQNLAKGTRYYFRARSRDKAGNLKISPVYSFVTRRY